MRTVLSCVKYSFGTWYPTRKSEQQGKIIIERAALFFSERIVEVFSPCVNLKSCYRKNEIIRESQMDDWPHPLCKSRTDRIGHTNEDHLDNGKFGQH